MRALLAIGVGAAFVAFALGYIPLDGDAPPVGVTILVAVMGAIAMLAGFAHLRLLWNRRRAYAGGREKRGTVTLLTEPGEDDTTAYLAFATTYDKWIMSVDWHSIRKVRDELGGGLPARAYLGEDDRIYGLDIGDIKALPISAGVPFSRDMQAKIAKVRKRKEELARKLDQNV